MPTKNRLYGVIFVVIYAIMKLKRAYLYDKFPFLSWFWDVFPNFLAGLFASFVLYYWAISKNKPQWRWLSVLIIGFYLTLEEYFPIISNSKTFDYKDVVFSWLGALLGTIWGMLYSDKQEKA